MNTLFTLAVIAIVLICTYRKGWKNGHDSAYTSMIKDLRKGGELFKETGLDNWDIPEHWKKYEAGVIRFKDVVDGGTGEMENCEVADV